MSGATAEVLGFAPRRRRAPDAAPVHKLRVLERCRRLVQSRELRRSCIAVAVYIAEAIDKDSGLATLRLRTIAAATTYSRGEVGKAVKELIDAGLLERISARRGHECLAAAFRLVEPVAWNRQPRRLQATTPSPPGDISRAGLDSSPSGQNPVAQRRAAAQHARQGKAREREEAANRQGLEPVVERALRERIGDQAFDAWCADAWVITPSRGDKPAVIGVPTRAFEQVLREKFGDDLVEAFGLMPELRVRPPPAP